MSDGSRQLEFPFSESPREALQKELALYLKSIGITGPEKPVLLFIWGHGHYRDNRTVVRASMERMAADMGCAKSTIHKGIHRLVKYGLVKLISLEDGSTAYRADWGLVRTFSPPTADESLHDLFDRESPDSESDGVRELFADRSRSRSRIVRDSVRGSFANDGAGRASGSSFEAFSEAESEKEEKETNKQNLVSSFVNSSLPEIFGALDSRGVEELPTRVFFCPASSVAYELQKYLAVRLKGTGVFHDDALFTLTGAVLRARELIHEHKRDMANPPRYVLKCLTNTRMSLPQKYIDQAREAWLALPKGCVVR